MDEHLYESRFMSARNKFICLLSFCSISVILANQSATTQPVPVFQEISSESFGGLQPVITIDGAGLGKWGFVIDFIAQTNFPNNAWIKTPNPFGSSLRLSLEDGTEITPTNINATSAIKLPDKTTVSNIMSTIP